MVYHSILDISMAFSFGLALDPFYESPATIINFRCEGDKKYKGKQRSSSSHASTAVQGGYYDKDWSSLSASGQTESRDSVDP